MKHLLTVLLLVLLVNTQTHGGHIVGGDLSYECLGNGQFRFTLTLYRQCFDGVSFTQPNINISGPVNGVLNRQSAIDYSPGCIGNTANRCINPSTANGTQGSLSRFVFVGVLNLSSLGPADSSGYSFYVNLPCCRFTLLNSYLQPTHSIVTTMYPYIDPISSQALSPAQLCDNSPKFIETPVQSYILNPFDTIFHQNPAYDPDGEDSITYRIDYMRNSVAGVLPYDSPYSITNPIPGLLGAPFVDPMNHPINPLTGEVIFRPTTAGMMGLPIIVSTYRSGQLISEVLRDYALNVFNNPNGSPHPPYNPFSNPIFTQRRPLIELDDSQFNTTFFIGDTVDIPIQTFDDYPTLQGNPQDPNTWVGANIGFNLSLKGPQLSPTNVASNCPNGIQPCATIRGYADAPLPAPVGTPPTNIAYSNGANAGLGYSTSNNVAGARFVWVPQAVHAAQPVPGGYLRTSRTHNFLVIANDLICPIVGKSEKTLPIHIRSLPVSPAPFNLIGTEDTTDHSIRLSFSSQIDTLSIDWLDSIRNPNATSAVLRSISVGRRLSTFQQYYLYRSIDQAAFQLIDSLSNPFDSTYHDVTANLRQHSYRYILSSISGLPVYELFGDEIMLSRNTTSVFDQSAMKFNLYPNPGKGWYTIELAESNLTADFELYDIKGRLLTSLSVPAGEQKTTLNLTNMPSGIYVLRMTNNGTTTRIVHQLE